jgi:small-conductance mechanosensitive channel
MEEIFGRLVIEPLRGFYDKTMEFLPNLFAALIVLLIGFAAGWLAKVVLEKICVILKLDLLSERTGFRAVLAKGGLQEPVSRLVSRLIGYFIVFIFFLAALNDLEFSIIQSLIERLLNYLPNIIIAVAVLMVGYMLGNFIGRATLIASVNAGIKISGPIGRCVKYLFYLIAISMALEQLGIGRDTMLVSFGIIFSGVVLALAIAFGLGGKDVAREYLERRFKEKETEDDIRHL